MNKHFDLTIPGVQIRWEEDDEVEYLGPAVLKGNASFTAATCKRGDKQIYYVYPIQEKMQSQQLIISYHSNPSAWRKSWGWEVCKGELIIDFSVTDPSIPANISFRQEGSRETQILEKGTDWVYIQPQPVQLALVEKRGRKTSSRLERPNQQRLRNLLLSQYGACQITGVRVPQALEACHIVPVKNGGTDDSANALLLRRDLHALFDAGLIMFCQVGEKWALHCDPNLQDTQYCKLEGALLSTVEPSSQIYLLKRKMLAGNG
jgi:hypothetical protein